MTLKINFAYFIIEIIVMFQQYSSTVLTELKYDHNFTTTDGIKIHPQFTNTDDIRI